MSFITSLLTTLIALLVYFTSKKMKSDRSRPIVQAIAALVGAVSLIALLFENFTVIRAGHVGVVETLGKVSNTPIGPGVHLLNPFSDVDVYSTRIRDVKEAIEATSQEGLSFEIEVSLQYRLAPEEAVEVYQAIGSDESEIIISRFRSIVREITARYPAEAIYSSKRQEVSDQLQQEMSQQLSPLGFVVEGAYLREIRLPDSLQAAIEQKLNAAQESQQMSFTLEQERQEAERKRVEAQGIADSQAIIARSLTNQTLQLRAIEATESLANSDNAKLLILGGGQGGAPLIFQLDPEMAAQGGGQ